jgi:hypothetical protein
MLLYFIILMIFGVREDLRLRMFENMALKRIFRPKREEVAGGWRRLHSEELHNLYASPNIVSDKVKTEIGGACNTHE